MFLFFINLIRVEESHNGGSFCCLLSSLNAGEANILDLLHMIYLIINSVKS